jgi:hypothetical protein
MSVCRAAAFIFDVERQYEWYAVEASWEVAEHYLTSVEAVRDRHIDAIIDRRLTVNDGGADRPCS